MGVDANSLFDVVWRGEGKGGWPLYCTMYLTTLEGGLYLHQGLGQKLMMGEGSNDDDSIEESGGVV